MALAEIHVNLVVMSDDNLVYFVCYKVLCECIFDHLFWYVYRVHF